MKRISNRRQRQEEHDQHEVAMGGGCGSGGSDMRMRQSRRNNRTRGVWKNKGRGFRVKKDWFFKRWSTIGFGSNFWKKIQPDARLGCLMRRIKARQILHFSKQRASALTVVVLVGTLRLGARCAPGCVLQIYGHNKCSSLVEILSKILVKI